MGGGGVVPLARAGASHLFAGHARARALGVVGAATFLGMALGPFAGAFVLGGCARGPGFAAPGGAGSTTAGLRVPAWRWVFYLGARLAVVGAIFIWAAAPAWPPPERRGRIAWPGGPPVPGRPPGPP